MSSLSNDRPPLRGSELARDTPRPARGYSALRSHRWSATGCTCFVTFCTQHRETGLATPELLASFVQERRAMEADQAWKVRAWTVMPDHIHILCELGLRLTLGRTIARFKGKVAPSLHTADLRWQSGYFEHRLRDPDEVRSTLFYLLMNPVRAELVDRGETWPGYYCSAEDWTWFKEYADEPVLEPSWLESADMGVPSAVASKLAPTERKPAAMKMVPCGRPVR